jgi:hypothetical protein
MYLQTILPKLHRHTYHCGSPTVLLCTVILHHIKIPSGAATTATCTESKKNCDSGYNPICFHDKFERCHLIFDKIDLNWNWGSRQEEMRLAALVAAKETVVQKNADAIKVFRFVVPNPMLCLMPVMEFMFSLG